MTDNLIEERSTWTEQAWYIWCKNLGLYIITETNAKITKL